MRNTFFLIASLLVAIGMAEATVRIASMIFPRIAYELRPPWGNRVVIEDPVLGFKLSPYFIEADARGYRNKRVLERPDVLAVGDSMTYGYTVNTDEAWPQQMAGATGLAVYNAGIGDYGPCEYLEVTRQTLDLKPLTVVLALYLGNDISDAYTSVYLEKRCQELKSDDLSVLQAIDRAESESSLRNKALGLGMEDVPWPFVQGLPDNDEIVEFSKVIEHSVLYRLIRTIYHKLADRQWKRFGDSDEETNAFDRWSNQPGVVAFEQIPELKTVFKNPDIEMLAVDQADPRIAEGRAVTERAIDKIRTLVEGQGISLVVAVIPSKSLVFEPVLPATDRYATNLFKQIALDNQLKDEVIAYLERANIPFIDLTQALIAMITRSVHPYYQSPNEHPNVDGYKAIADGIATVVDP